MKKRHELDPTFKQMLLKFLEPFPVTIETEVEVSRLPRTIDVIVVTQSEDAHEQLKLHTPFGHFRPYNQIEFKGISDRLTAQNYLTILGRTYFYMSENKVALTDMSVTIVCARKPITVLDRRITSHTFTENGAGIYQNEGIPQVTIIVVNELPVTPINIPLILFAGNKAKFREAVLQLLAENNVEYVSYALLIRPHETQELAEMTNRYEENMKIIARDMGPDMIKYMEPQVLMEAFASEQLIASLSMKNIEWLRQLTTEKTVWHDLHELDMAQDRIQLLEELSTADQSLIIDLDKLDQLVKGLNKAERATLITWLSDRIAEEDEG